MRTLVLSSKGVPHDLRDHTRGDQAVLISAAAEVYPGDGHRDKILKDTARLMGAGFRVYPVDLRELDEEDAEMILTTDLLWVGGGNTFRLVQRLHESGVADEVPALLDEGVVWGGESAGSVCCAPTLAGVELEDDPRFSNAPNLPGLNLVPFLPWAHWNPQAEGHETRRGPLASHVTTPMYRFRDGEYLLVRGTDVELRTMSTDVGQLALL